MAVTWISLFIANFCFIGLKAWQQRNVAYLKYGSVFLVSNILAAVEIYVIFRVAAVGPTLETVIPIGTGGALGCVTAMYLTRGHGK